MGIREAYQERAVAEVEAPSGLRARLRRLNALAITNVMRGFPSLFGPSENGHGEKKVLSMDELIGGGEYQKALIERAVISFSLDGETWEPVASIPFEDLDGDDAQYLVNVIQNGTDLVGRKADEARSFRGGPESVPVG